uniref:Rpn family recombination-promoting nuclease/putative transposase n=1 Tax=Prevotella sp. TaxID=59823 RepID=UPI0040264321
MGKYLDPRADLTFKKVFADHKDLMISFLNAMLPLPDDGQVTSIEYLPFELIPTMPLKKDTIVDVRCEDQLKRQFIVEMQMIWTADFFKRVLFNSSKAYVKQLKSGDDYSDLQPVYSLNLINEAFLHDTDEWYHDYGLMEFKYPNHVIEDMHVIFIELPKFKPHSFTEKKMTALWLRFLTEIDGDTKIAPKELLENPETRKALDIVEESAYSDAQMAGYDHFWDMVSVERTLHSSVRREREKGKAEGKAEGLAEGLAEGMKQGKAEGLAEGMKQGMKQGLAQGAHDSAMASAKAMKADGMPTALIAKYTGLSEEVVAKL